MNTQKIFVSFAYYENSPLNFYQTDQEIPKFGNTIIDLDLDVISNFTEMILTLEKKIREQDPVFVEQVVIVNVQKTDNFLNFK